MRHFFRLFIFCGLAMLSGQTLFARQSPQVAPSNLLLVLDASGSMWGQIEGKNKIVIAREVLKNMLGGLPATTQVGLVAYGHRSEGDCEDIELISPLAPVDAAALAQKIEALNPKGKTPITGAIRTAFESVKTQQPATIILVSDGLETCGGDPCATVREAKQAGIEFVMHVVGFDVEKEEMSQLECTAQTGGGLYFSAQNADELSAALDKTVAAPAELPSGMLAVGAIVDGQLQDAIVKVVREDSGEEVARGRTYSAETTNPRYLPVPAGTYRIEVQALRMQGDVRQQFTGIVVAEGDTVRQTADFSTGELAIKVTRNGELSDATVRVYRSGTTEEVAAGRTYRGEKTNPRVFRITPGSYDVLIGSVEISSKPKLRLEKIMVEAGERSEHSHDFHTGTLKIGAVQGDQLVDATVRVREVHSGQPVGQGRTYTNAKSNPRTFELAPGEYTVDVGAVKLAGRPKRTITVTVVAGKVTEEKVDFQQ